MSRRKTYPRRTARCLKRQPEFSTLDKSRPLFILGFTLLIFVFVGAATFYISTHVRMVDIGYKINQEINRKQNLIEENKRLRLEIARLKSPTRIEQVATTQLDMAIPGAGQVVYLSQLENESKKITLASYLPSEPMEEPAPKLTQPSKPKTTSAPKIEKTEPKAEKSPPKKTVVAKKSPPAPSRSEAPPVKTVHRSEHRHQDKIIIAKVIRGEPKPVSDLGRQTNSGAKLKKKESVPAVVLDPMP